MTDSSPEKPVILVVDDSRVIRLAARKMLGSDYDVIEAADGQEGWQHIQDNDAISVVFTDLQMPQMNGLEMLAKVRGSDDERIAALPVIMITGQEDSEQAKKDVFERGATDFISKPFESIDLVSRAKSYARLTRKVVELEKQTGHDKLTGLFNTNSFQEHGDKVFSFAHRHKVNMSVVLLEVDTFQKIFLAYGKVVAQQIIIAVSKRLSESMRAEDIAARVGVARFALLLSMTNLEETQIVVARIRETINKLLFDTGKQKIRVALAAGITVNDYNADGDFSGLVKQAESALGDALASESEKIVTFSTRVEPPAPVQETEVSEHDIQQAISLILRGEYLQIPESHLSAVVERLSPFMQYVESRHEAPRFSEGGGSQS